MYIINVCNKEQRHIIQVMRRRQKRNYYLSFIGGILSFIDYYKHQKSAVDDEKNETRRK